MSREVRGSGPWMAPLLFVGEGPGRTEEAKGAPFQGMTGKFVRSTLHRAGMEPENVRFNNVLPVRCWVPPDWDGRRRLLEKWKDNIETDLVRCTDAKVIVACGALAWQKLSDWFGLTT